MNKDKILAAVTAIEKASDKYDQTAFGESQPSCDSPCCLAGWLCFLEDGQIPSDADSKTFHDNPVKMRAQAIAELTNDQAYNLFSPCLGDNILRDPITAKTLRFAVSIFFEEASMEPHLLPPDSHAAYLLDARDASGEER